MSESAENDIMATIRGLMDEEHALRSAPGGLEPEERGRMEEVEAALDQCWDLLRQRRARSEFGQDPDEARVRPASEVENYRQ
ncbi:MULTISPECIES: DUF2630 family protein [Nocardiopsidaceae]|jgi:hypothetical protein|uniref:DUF2630 family protein n=2 Tax=Nocardiopsidaceae TaxID=83676 RepID=A0ABY6YRM1_9ACTN|nr:MULTISPECIES: DUF2630 family protein [Nocardiopsaceae]MEE2044735.1 DUF2630 family protein [Nocardiopsis tropica]MEE2049328.1 DUF2630 family protein [Nocardiopsis umidischolae]WAE75012.1 DUF2630 family protein [Streptomonospora nanhaiensis]